MTRPAATPEDSDPDPRETAEWLEAFTELRTKHGEGRALHILRQLHQMALGGEGRLKALVQTPYINSIPIEKQIPYPGDLEVEKRIRAILRWNAAMIVHRAYLRGNYGGHIATYASAATLYEVGFNHFFRAGEAGGPKDLVYFQGHSTPGIYARAFLEGFLTEDQMDQFRHEVGRKGLSAYPNSWRMPHFWETSNGAAGIGPLQAIYQARLSRYLRNRDLKDTADSRVWAFVGDGECDDPYTLGALPIAAREGLDNLIFVVNCNLQRLDGPVLGNSKIIQELEAVFHGAGWNVLKVLWGSDWDALLVDDKSGLLVKRMEEVVDGDFQRYSAWPGSHLRQHFFGKYPELTKLVEAKSDEELSRLRRGGHDPLKVFAAYHWATTGADGRPTVILAKTVKGWATGLEGKNQNHQEKRFKEGDLKAFRDRLEIPIPDATLGEAPYYMPAQDSDELEYLRERRRALGGYLPRRNVRVPKEPIPKLDVFQDCLDGTVRIASSSTASFNSVFRKILINPGLGKRVSPIFSDEARTFGLDPLFGALGIYSPLGQRYEPVDIARRPIKVHYSESKDGQVLQEGANRPGALASFIAAGTAYANHGINLIPFYTYFSFGSRQIADLVWVAAESRTRGFLLGAAAGRTTLSGEGIHTQDVQSPIFFAGLPNCRVYDPAWGYEIAVIVHDGLRRMLEDREDCFYYITLYIENYMHPPMPEGVEEGILKGLYRFKPSSVKAEESRKVQLLGSGAMLPEVLRAQGILEERFGVAGSVWSATSFVELRRDAQDCEDWNLKNPDCPKRVPYVVSTLGKTKGPILAATDFSPLLPEMISRWLPGRFHPLGSDGFGLSDMRPVLRRHFGVDAESIAWAALVQLSREGGFPSERLSIAREGLGLQ